MNWSDGQTRGTPHTPGEAMADDFKRARIQRSQLMSCDCCYNPASNKDARRALQREDRTLIEQELTEWIGDSRRKCGVCGEWDLDTCALEC